ncbi:VolA/Pla-1 family phospholipase [Photobacterium kagoshimensis]|uniref:VolA/Pla-1 family phospholipase n=1 Tax=Photobacterium kagoshimensis TaxID=2910242 RepID=UPI003D0A874B
MKKQLLALMIASTLGLTGCGNESSVEGDSTISYEQGIQQSLKAPTKVKFQLQGAKADMPRPSFLLMDSSDGTLGLPTDNKSIADPVVAMNSTDGWSTTQPIMLSFEGNDLDPTSITTAFKLIKVSDPTTTDPAAQQPVVLKATFNPAAPDLTADYLVFVQGKSVIAQPIKPLDASSHYMFALTDDLKDVKGNKVGLSGSYASLKTKKSEPVEKLKDAQKIIHLTEGLMAATGTSADSIIYSSWFSTASAGDVMFATKAAIASTLNAFKAQQPASTVWKGTANPNNISDTKLNTLFQLSAGQDITSFSPIDLKGAKAYKGTLTLPYFLETEVNGKKWQSTPWQSAMPSLAILKSTLASGSDAEKAAVAAKMADLKITEDDLKKAAEGDLTTQVTLMTKLMGEKIEVGGKQLDTNREITRYSPIPQLKSVETIDYLMVMPDSTKCTSDVPVTIYQHGITSKKETMLALASSVSTGACTALMAIDLPLHGSRSLSDGTVTDGANADVYMNLSYLPVGRDNLRQSIADQMSLRAALGATISKTSPPAPFDKLSLTNGVGFLGHSLGAITGIDFTAVTNRQLSPDPAVEGGMFKISRAQYANPGAGIPYLLLNSTAFGGTVKDGVLTTIPDYKAYKEAKCGSSTSAKCVSDFYDSLTAAKKAEIDGLFTQFAYAAQTVLDSVDPINHIGDIDTSIPVLINVVKDDEVIPNALSLASSKPYSPFGGTMPLIAGFEQLSTAGQTSTSPRVATLFNAGTHSSLLTPVGGSVAVTAEMQKQTALFITTGTTTVTNDTVLFTTP